MYDVKNITVNSRYMVGILKIVRSLCPVRPVFGRRVDDLSKPNTVDRKQSFPFICESYEGVQWVVVVQRDL